MGIRDMAAEAAETQAKAVAVENARKRESRDRALHDKAYAWCMTALLAPDEVIVEEHSHRGETALVRIDDVWMRWYETPPKPYYREEQPPAVTLVALTRRDHTRNKDGTKFSVYVWDELLDPETYVARSMAELGNLLKRLDGGTPRARYGGTIVNPDEFKHLVN